MMTVEIIVILGCLLPFLMFLVAIFACELRIQYRDGDTRRFPRHGTEPFRPESKIKPFKKSPDMLTKVDDE